MSILVSCHETKEQRVPNLSTEKQDQSFNERVDDSKILSSLSSDEYKIDLEKFIAISSQIFNIKKELIETEMDSTFKKQQFQNETKNIYNAIRHNASSYRQIELTYDRRFTVQLYELRFDDIQSAEEMFDTFKVFGMTRDMDLTPGLTYTNDYLRLDKNSVFWLNSPCMVSIPNHLKLVKAFQEMLELSPVEKSAMHCKCGAIFCTLADDL